MKNAETQIPATPAAQEKPAKQPKTWSDLTPFEREFLEAYHRADPEAQELIFRELPLLVLFGDPFFQEIEKPALAWDRPAMRAIIEKWEARAAELEPVKT